MLFSSNKLMSLTLNNVYVLRNKPYYTPITLIKNKVSDSKKWVFFFVKRLLVTLNFQLVLVILITKKHQKASWRNIIMYTLWCFNGFENELSHFSTTQPEKAIV